MTHVFAGTINTDGTLRVQVTAAAENNTIARVVRLVEEAQEAKAPTERFIDRFARYYTPVVLIFGFSSPSCRRSSPASPGVSGSTRLAVLLVGCPCALVIDARRHRRRSGGAPGAGC